MSKLPITPSEKPKNSQSSSSIMWIILAVAILFIGLAVFTLTLLSSTKSQASEFEITNLKQIGETKDSVLISWDCTGSADEYLIKCTDKENQIAGQITCDVTFASISELEPNSSYTIEVIPIKNGHKNVSALLQCSTGEYCGITSVNINSCTANSVTASWEYDGVDKGFTAIAYAVDIFGKRHLTSDEIDISIGDESTCTINGLLPEMKYTVTIMPKARFNDVGKSDFETQSDSISYSKLEIIRAVVCPDDTQETVQVNKLKSLVPSNSYKISMIISGEASKDDKVNMALYIKNSSGNLVSETSYPDIYTNPKGANAYKQRFILLQFTAPTAADSYTGYITIDGELVKRVYFDTFDK